ncbi:CvpA family protein [Novosphingobium piscinae]|uniref:CvpA family protein n=1 Tax=Novosphingobium piscinae TaxID=1507448 RepID=A0A7X1FZZ6_9SPHN|nr:CvpA family protein [Novosphingobium piscinae]MBC2669457.1 CvpA family protein [Novosphingobium piscinae]
MTGFDICVLVLVGLGAVMGFLRGFVQEVLALAAWGVSLVAIHYAHTPASLMLEGYVGNRMGANAILAFALLLLIPYVVVKLIAGRLGQASRSSFLGPVDRVIGFGFGAVKGMLIAVIGFSILVLGYDTVWGVDGRPDWITQSRTYPFINASSDALVTMIGERRREAAEAASAEAGRDEEAPAERRSRRRRPARAD